MSNEAFSAQAAEERAIWAHDKRMLEQQLLKLQVGSWLSIHWILTFQSQAEFGALQQSTSATSQAAIESWDNEREALLDKILLLESRVSSSGQQLQDMTQEQQKQQRSEERFRESVKVEEVALQEQNQVWAMYVCVWVGSWMFGQGCASWGDECIRGSLLLMQS